MLVKVRQWLPEVVLGACGLFFFAKELGTFPAAWIDDGLYMIAARMILEGHGIALPVLDRIWNLPSVLHVGPTLLYPVALSMKLFGISVAAARVPMVLYLIGVSTVLYALTRRYCGRGAALWTLALLVSLSAFVNTGKPVMGEVPGAFYLLLGFFTFERGLKNWRFAILTGLFFGLAAITKVTYGLVFPALGITLIAALFNRQTQLWKMILIMIATGFIVFAPWKIAELLANGWNFLEQYTNKLPKAGAGGEWHFLGGNPTLLLRFPYVYFAVLFVFAWKGMKRAGSAMHPLQLLTLWSCAILFVLYFLSGPGWYRHLLLAHMLILPFVPVGMHALLSRPVGTILLIVFIGTQAVWQIDYRGASRSTEGATAADVIRERYTDADLVIRQAEVYFRLSENPRWRFLPHDMLAAKMPAAFTTRTEEELCFPEIVKSSDTDIENRSDVHVITGPYVIIDPPASCRR